MVLWLIRNRNPSSVPCAILGWTAGRESNAANPSVAPPAPLYLVPSKGRDHLGRHSAQSKEPISNDYVSLSSQRRQSLTSSSIFFSLFLMKSGGNGCRQESYLNDRAAEMNSDRRKSAAKESRSSSFPRALRLLAAEEFDCDGRSIFNLNLHKNARGQDKQCSTIKCWTQNSRYVWSIF